MFSDFGALFSLWCLTQLAKMPFGSRIRSRLPGTRVDPRTPLQYNARPEKGQYPIIIIIIIIRFVQYLSLLQGDLALFLTADERPGTPEHLVPSTHLMSKGCWEETNPVLNYPLKKTKNITHEQLTH